MARTRLNYADNLDPITAGEQELSGEVCITQRSA